MTAERVPLALDTVLTDADWPPADFTFYQDDGETPEAGWDNADITFRRRGTGEEFTYRTADASGLAILGAGHVSIRAAAAMTTSIVPGTYDFELRRLGNDGSIEAALTGMVTVLQGLNSGGGCNGAPAFGNGAQYQITRGDGMVQVIRSAAGPQGNSGWAGVYEYNATGPQGAGMYLTGWTGGQGPQPTSPPIGSLGWLVNTADATGYDDTATGLGVGNVQDALETLAVGLTLSGNSYEGGIGTLIGTFADVLPGCVPMLEDTDGVLAISGNPAGGWKLNVGGIAAPYGLITATVIEVNTASNAVARRTRFSIFHNAPLPALPLPVGAKAVALGHSFIEHGGTTGTSTPLSSFTAHVLNSAFEWFPILDRRINVDEWADAAMPYNAATGGNAINGAFQGIGGDHLVMTSAVTSGTIPRTAYMLKQAPAFVYLVIGTNDINSGGLTLAQLQALYLHQLLLLRAGGCYVIADCISARGDTGWGPGSANDVMRLAFNTWLQGLTAAYTWLTVNTMDDIFGTADALNTNCYLSDLVHPSSYGAYQIANTKLLPWIQANVTAGDYYDPTYTGADNVWPHAALPGTGGYKAGYPPNAPTPTGNVADIMGVYRSSSNEGKSTIACSKEDIDGTYSKQVITITPVVDGVTTHTCRITAGSSAGGGNVLLADMGIAEGDWVEWSFFLELNAWAAWGTISGSRGPNVGHGSTSVWNQGTFNLPNSIALPTSGAATLGFSGRVWTRFQIPVGRNADTWLLSSLSSILEPQWQPANAPAMSTGVIKISAPILRKITDPRIIRNLAS